MALSFEQVDANKSKEIRIKAPAALVEEFENGKKELKDRGIVVNTNEELVRTLTKMNTEIQAYLRDNPRQREAADAATGAGD